MASGSPSASPYALPPVPAGSPPSTTVPPPLPPQLPPAPAPSQHNSSSNGSLSPPSPAPLAQPTGESALPPPSQPVPPSPSLSLPPSSPPTAPLPPPTPPPPSPGSPVLLPVTTSPSAPPLSALENFPPPPPRAPQNSTSPPSQLSPQPPPNPTKAPPQPPPSDSPPKPSKSYPPPTHSPSTSPSTASPAPPPKQAAIPPPPPASTSPQSPPSSTHPDADSPTPIHNSSEASPTVEKNSGIGTGGTLGIGIGIGIFILSFIGLVILCANRRRRKASKFSKGHIIPTSISISPASDSSVMKIPSSAPHIGSTSGSESIHSPDQPPGGYGSSRLWITYDDLEMATNGFSTENLLGEGGFGSVYKGCLQDGREVAVKQLKDGAKQGEREFRAEVDIISRIHHRYLVSLVGYCIADNWKLLVYDYVPNNTLYFHLHGGRPVLNWAARVKIAAGASRGLAYLHEDCHPRIIHRDIKSSNILLDHDFEARVSDFGLAKLALDAQTHITTRVMGTFGYMAPEYAISGKLTEKSDIYSFGVVLLELITGRKPVDTSQPLGDEGLVEWARPLLSHALDHEEFEGLVDPRLEGNYVEIEMLRMIEAAAACVRHLASKRPRMGQIVRAFDSFVESDLTNGMRIGESEIFNSAQQSLEIHAFRRMQFGSQGSSTGYFSQTTIIT